MEHSEKLSVVCFSWDFDRAVAVFTLAAGAAATNREVTIFFTFWGLNIVKKQPGHRGLGRGILARLFNFLMGGRGQLPLSRLNFGGVSPRLMIDEVIRVTDEPASRPSHLTGAMAGLQTEPRD